MKRFGWLAFFAWVPVFGVLLTMGAVTARTQVIFAYEYTGGRGYAGVQGRTYTRCTYVGLNGIVTVPTQAGRCAWLRLSHAGGR